MSLGRIPEEPEERSESLKACSPSYRVEDRSSVSTSCEYGSDAPNASKGSLSSLRLSSLGKDPSDISCPCDLCEEEGATIVCLDCEGAKMCKRCAIPHGKLREMKTHRTLPLRKFGDAEHKSIIAGAKASVCPTHELKMNAYCMDCRVDVCGECLKMHRKCQGIKDFEKGKSYEWKIIEKTLKKITKKIDKIKELREIEMQLVEANLDMREHLFLKIQYTTDQIIATFRERNVGLKNLVSKHIDDDYQSREIVILGCDKTISELTEIYSDLDNCRKSKSLATQSRKQRNAEKELQMKSQDVIPQLLIEFDDRNLTLHIKREGDFSALTCMEAMPVDKRFVQQINSLNSEMKNLQSDSSELHQLLHSVAVSFSCVYKEILSEKGPMVKSQSFALEPRELKLSESMVQLFDSAWAMTTLKNKPHYTVYYAGRLKRHSTENGQSSPHRHIQSIVKNCLVMRTPLEFHPLTGFTSDFVLISFIASDVPVDNWRMVSASMKNCQKNSISEVIRHFKRRPVFQTSSSN